MTTRFGGWTFDADRRQVVGADGDALHLTRKAFDLLALLIAEAPRVVRKSELHDRLWPEVFVSDAAVVSLVKELRRALRDHDPEARIIRTSHGVGYAFCAVAEPGAAPAAPIHWIMTSERRFGLREGENVIGRDPTAAVWLDVAGVSRRHALVVVRGEAAEIEDLGSKNGTRLGEQPLAARVRLQSGDQIRVGPVRLSYGVSGVDRSTETLLNS